MSRMDETDDLDQGWEGKELHQLHPNLLDPKDAPKIKVICADVGIAIPRDKLNDQMIQIRQVRKIKKSKQKTFLLHEKPCYCSFTCFLKKNQFI